MAAFRVGLAALVALAAAVVFAAPAVATHGTRPAFDPQTTNVPYLAWRGEELRLVKCAAEITTGTGGAGQGQSVDFIVEQWSGHPFRPPALETSTVRFFTGTGQHARRGCVRANFVSQLAGLATIKLVVSGATGPVMKHQFLAGWLSLNAPTCRELATAMQPGGGGVLGDPFGDGNLAAGGAPGRVQCDVTGELPLAPLPSGTGGFEELPFVDPNRANAIPCEGIGPDCSITLPANTPFTGLNDPGATFWDDLARGLASTSDTRPLYRDAPWQTWDIHDDRTRVEGHVNPVAQGCGPGPDVTTEAVDDCEGDAFDLGGTFTRVFGNQSLWPTIGPFDPLRANETLLSDGKLDGGDVPMPSARLDVSIAPNTGAPGDISGVGFLSGTLKCEAYTRVNRCGPPAAQRPHNFYAPFYARYQPATAALHHPQGAATPRTGIVQAAEASGNDGPAIGNNFPGYGTFSARTGVYPFWLVDQALRTALGGNTTCLERIVDGQRQFRQRPAGLQAATIWTDEHGEAQIWFHPGTGFFFDNLGIGTNLNQNCDLQGIDVLGTAAIQAIARYPAQRVTDPDKASREVIKRVRNLFSKTVDCQPKGPIPPITNGFAFICTATAIDITGAPIEGERVCFTAGGTGAEGMMEYPIERLGEGERQGQLRLCLTTLTADDEAAGLGDAGTASVEILGKCGTGNVFADFPEEGGLLRVDFFTFACPPGGGGGTSEDGTSNNPTGSTASSSPVPEGVTLVPPAPDAVIQNLVEQVSAASRPEAKPAAKPKKATLAFARIEKKPFAKQSERYVVVRVNGQARTARIQVTLIGKNGRVLGRVVRTVRTNRVVRVPNLKLPLAVKTARVRVIA